MRWFDMARVRVRALFSRRAVDEQLDADLQFHLEQAAAEYAEQGLSRGEARLAALRVFGNPARVVEDVRDMSLWTSWDRLTQDVQYGLRTFRRNPAFAATVVLCLAIGIGANTAIFTLINAALLRPLPVSHPEQLAILNPIGDDRYSYPEYLALREGSRAFSDVIATSSLRKTAVRAGADTDQALVKMVTGNYFVGLGVPAAIGRVFSSADEVEPVAVVSRGYWSRRFGDSPAALGQPIAINGVPFTIVGVAPAGFFGEAPGESPDVWTTLALQLPEQRRARGFSWLQVMGRLKPATTREQAELEVNAVLAQARTAGIDGAVRRVEVSPGARGSSWLRSLSNPLRVLMAVVMVVLVIACTNVASLLLARGAARQGEIAMRLAVGANCGRIIRQLVTESVLLAAFGGALGLAFAFWTSGFLVRLVAGFGRPLVLDVQPDLRVLLFTGAVSVAAGVLSGLFPAWRAVNSAAGLAVADAGRRVVGREGLWGIRDSLIVVQLALSLVLLAASAMFIRTLSNLQGQDLGFQADHVLLVQVVPERGYRPALPALVPQLLERTQTIPGVDIATVAFSGTLAVAGGVNGLQIAGDTPREPQDQRARADWVGPNYLRTAGIPLVAGRDFALADHASAPRVAIVNHTFARFYFADGDAVGRRFTFNKNPYEIVGIAKDAKYNELRETSPRVVYFSLLQGGGQLNSLEVRTNGRDPASIAAALRTIIREVDSRLSIGEVTTLSARIDRTLSREHLVASLTAFFSGLTLLLVSIGMYGTLAYSTMRRTTEIAVRLALGSPRAAVLWLVLQAVLVRLTIGLLLGVAGVLASGRLMASMLFGLRPNDPATITVAAIVLIAVALMASFLPAVRASGMDPAAVLRDSSEAPC
jgi:predicted permease